MDRLDRITKTVVFAARAFRGISFVLVLCLGVAQGWAQQNDKQGKQDKKDRQEMRGLDEQVQEIKSDVLAISAELSQLEEKLLYPSGTQVAIFVAVATGDPMRLDAVRLQIDGQLVAHYIYSFKELEALRKGGVQRIYVGNVATGDHQLEVLVDGKLEGGADFSRNEHFSFRKDVKPKLVGLTLAGPESGHTPITLGEW
jgi:predicted negative regulator of RcsB-dependent stress response